MRLHNLLPLKVGAFQRKKRLGRGRGSGHGKTCGKGFNGQKSRSGAKLRIGFEGGQMPIYRKLPRRGFNNARFQKNYSVVNIKALSKINKGEIITQETLVNTGLVDRKAKRIKIIGNAKIDKTIEVKLEEVSSSANAKIRLVK